LRPNKTLLRCYRWQAPPLTFRFSNRFVFEALQAFIKMRLRQILRPEAADLFAGISLVISEKGSLRRGEF
jgi:hypothetical protein